MNRHLRIVDFAIASLRRSAARTIVVVTVYSLLTAVVGSLLLYVKACRDEARHLLAEAPDLVVQTVRGGRQELTDLNRAVEIRQFRGVSSVTPRVWGYSFDPPIQATITLWGAESAPLHALELEADEPPSGGLQGGCVIGAGLADLRFLGIGDRYPMRRSDGTLFAPRVVGIFTTSSALLTNDLVVMPTRHVRELFGIAEELCTDIAVEVHNRNEVSTVARKVLELWPDARTITRDEILRTYDAVFDWRGGMWAAILLGSVASFMVLVWDKGTGLSEEESRNVGLLKALGWKSREVMELKLIEGAAVSVIALTAGLILAQLHLLLLRGSVFSHIIKGWSVLYPSFPVNAPLDLSTVSICVAFLAVPYVAANLIPAWRIAVTDPDAVLRS